MLIINADDLGRSRAETDVTLEIFRAGRLSSTTAMVFMEDSARAAELAIPAGISVGLHLNLDQSFTGENVPAKIRETHERVVKFIKSSKYSQCVYHPALRREFREAYQAQIEEFTRLYGRRPSHIDGHHHAHLCTNMLLDGIIEPQERVRRSFSFRPGEKGLLNRVYRQVVDWSLGRRYRLTDFFFSLQQSLQHNRLARVFELSRTSVVELMTHPVNQMEYSYLMSDECGAALRQLQMGNYGLV